MDWAPTYKERFPEWRSSDGALQESAAKSNEGNGTRAEALTGYQSSEAELKRGEQPQKIWELSNSYGSLAVGKNKKKQLVLVNSRRRTKQLHQLTPESKALQSGTSVRIPLISGEFRFNEAWNRRDESAYAYQLEAGSSPDYLMRKMQELSGKREPDAQKTVGLFFDLRPEKEELAYLRAIAQKTSGVRTQKEDQGLRARSQFLTAVLADKERQRLKFYAKLPQLLTEAQQEESRDWDYARLKNGEPATEPGEGEENPDPEENPET